MTALGREALDRALLRAHAAQDLDLLVALYTEAADMAEAHHDEGATYFYLTHAFIFALEAGRTEADALNARLAAAGRAERLSGLG